jgi:hypothetical protein
MILVIFIISYLVVGFLYNLNIFLFLYKKAYKRLTNTYWASLVIFFSYQLFFWPIGLTFDIRNGTCGQLKMRY